MALCVVLSGCQTLRQWTGPPSGAEQETELRDVESREFSLPQAQQVVGGLYTIRLRDGDTLPGVARHYALGYDDLIRANPGIDPWIPSAGRRILLPMRHVLPDGPREGIVLNLANMRLFHFPPEDRGESVFTAPVGIGREGWETPTGTYAIAEKKVNPTWIPPASVLKEHEEKGDPLPRVVPPGPDNPLGGYALRLSAPSYLIHGTNKPYGVGMQVSHGCVRLYPEDIERLFSRIDVGATVRIVDQPFLLGWHSGELLLEAHPPLEGQEEHTRRVKENLFTRLEQEAAQRGATIDWARVEEVLRRQDGVPTPILASSPGFEAMAASARALAHPVRFYGQPVPGPLDADAWSLAVASFDVENEARRIAAMLNHQGPPIPSRTLRDEAGYRVIAGPFEDEEEVLAVAERIRRDFELDAQPVAPETVAAK